MYNKKRKGITYMHEYSDSGNTLKEEKYLIL